MQEIDYEEYQIEIENRIKNLMWTVSGDYNLNVKPDIQSFSRSKYISLYDAIKQGAFALYFDTNELASYIMKKLYYDAEEPLLMSIAQLCVDSASYKRIIETRPGVEQVRRKAFEDMLDLDYRKMSESLLGRVKIQMIKEFLYNIEGSEKRLSSIITRIKELENAAQTMDIIRAIDYIYNNYIDRSFERKHGDLDYILELEMDEVLKDSWQDFLNDEIYESVLERYLDEMSRRMTSLEEEISEEEKEEQQKGTKKHVVIVDEEAVEKMGSYMELSYGKSYLTEAQQKSLNRRLCTGAHADCNLYYTDGILQSPVIVNAQYVYAKKKASRNRLLYQNSKSLVMRNVEIMTANLRRSLIMRSEKEEIPSDYGTIVPHRLWRIGRTDTNRLFQKTIKQNSSEFVVEILMDASDSQRNRQSEVALQALIISEALSNVGIPHRVMSFCSFWDYTVMQRFREYDAPRSENKRILEFSTSSNNRDGLAIRAAADSLLARDEDNKILIVLSDGRPNDVIVNRPNSRNPQTYSGDYAVNDTAMEVRKLRNLGVFVLGVFAGKEKDLAAEKRIFGKDFAYIKKINNFANVVGQYLQKLLDW